MADNNAATKKRNRGGGSRANATQKNIHPAPAMPTSPATDFQGFNRLCTAYLRGGNGSRTLDTITVIDFMSWASTYTREQRGSGGSGGIGDPGTGGGELTRSAAGGGLQV